MPRFLRTRWGMLLAAALILGAPGAWLMARDSGDDVAAVVASVKRGDFKVLVTTAGELRAREFVQIQGPANAQQAEAYQMKISSIVPEGTVVKAGDIVAELDRSMIAGKLSEVSLALQKAEAQYEQAMLDSTLNLSKAREDIRTMDLALEEKRIAKEQAIYEAPSVQRQAEIDLEKATRALAQGKLDYKTKTEQAEAKMREVGADLERQRNKQQIVMDVMAGFTIRAPAPGMVIYVKEWNGRKKTAGSQINPWDPTVATLPDLEEMESVTYVSEIDVRKVAAGQPVTITLDADPTKRLTGKVTSVANVGEQRPNSDSKVFEVKVVVQQSDTTLRPGMTTGNQIETYALKDALFIPIEAVSVENDVPIVFKRSAGGVVKQEVRTGAMNDDAVVIVSGLEEDDEVLLSVPADRASLELRRLPGSQETTPEQRGDTAAPAVPVPVRPDSVATPTPSAPPARTPARG